MPTILILGALSDVATAIAYEYASRGYHVMLAARNPEKLGPHVSDIQIRFGVGCSAHEFDATKTETHLAFYNSLPASPDTLALVFGYLGDQSDAQNNWEETHRIIATNFLGAVSILNIVANDFARKQSGTIIGISSVAGERGRQSNYIYGSSKAGLTAYLSGLRNRMYPSGVHVMTVQPGFIRTRMTENMKLPPLLTASPSEVAKAVYASDKKKKNIIYVKWFWKWIMFVIKAIPEGVFKKLKL